MSVPGYGFRSTTTTGDPPTNGISVVRRPADDPALREDATFLNPGGPGGSGVDLVVKGEPLGPTGPGWLTASPDTTTIAVWGAGRGVRFHDRASLQERGQLDISPQLSITGFAFAPDGSSVATLTCPPLEEEYCPAQLSVWDVESGARTAGPVEAGVVWAPAENGLTYAANGMLIATIGGRDETALLWDAQTLAPHGEALRLAEVAPLPGETRMVAAGDVAGRSVLVAMGAAGQSVAWELDAGHPPAPLGWMENAVRLGFTPDGLLVTSGGRGPFVFRDPFTLEPVSDLFVASVPPNSFSFSDNGLLVSSGSGGAELWDLESGRPLSGVIPSQRAVVSPDGALLYLGAAGFPSLGQIVRTVSLDPGDLRIEACRRAGRNLTTREWADFMGDTSSRRATCEGWPLPES